MTQSDEDNLMHCHNEKCGAIFAWEYVKGWHHGYSAFENIIVKVVNDSRSWRPD
jgi:hypothetical protein